MRIFIYILLSLSLLACSKSNSDYNWGGKYNGAYIISIEGFTEQKPKLLFEHNITNSEFINLSTTAAWTLTAPQQTKLKKFRDDLRKPTSGTLLQKVIPMEDMTTYMNNKYGGTVGGFVMAAADVKNLCTMSDVFWGLRLDYEGTKFLENGAGYAVIRFYSDATEKLSIPYCAELGGTNPHSWPNGGGGFTTSTLGYGGYPEVTFDGYYPPKDGAELYEVTTNGYQLLRAVFIGGAWQTYEVGIPPISKSSQHEDGVNNSVERTKEGTLIYRQTLCIYKGHMFNVRAIEDEIYHITTQTGYKDIEMEVIEKGIWGLSVAKEDIEKVWVEENIK